MHINSTHRYYFLTFLFISACLSNTFAQKDSILGYRSYIENILIYHPLSQSAALKLEQAKAERMTAKGNLDPTITSTWKQKNFDDKLYYKQFETMLKFPTALGVDIVGGYSNTDGVYINPQNKTDINGLWQLGVEVNVLQGLITNERRTALKQAEVFSNLAKNEQLQLLNDLIYAASATYLQWQQYNDFKNVLNENIEIAETYYQNTRQSYLNGEKTVMDTLESFIMYQDAISYNQSNQVKLIKARQMVENYMWYMNTPLGLQEHTKPEAFQASIFPDYEYQDRLAVKTNPVILAALNKLSYLEIEQRLKKEKLKPKLKVKYMPLIKTSEASLPPQYAANDYAWGFSFSMPLLLRSERANIQKGRIKIEELELQTANKRNELLNKIESSWQQQMVLSNQILILQGNVHSYKLLLQGENDKFNFGESSVFLLNKRQEKYINSQLKLIDTSIKQKVELLNFLYFSNQLL